MCYTNKLTSKPLNQFQLSLVKLLTAQSTFFVVFKPNICTSFAKIMVDTTVQTDHFHPDFQIVKTNDVCRLVIRLQ